MAQLAIKSHPTRGEEVVGILSMLGGIQCGYGSNCKGFYFIDDCKNIVAYDNIPEHRKNGFIIFTLEEFLEKFPYKVGDKVLYKIYGIHSKIKSMLWNKEKEQVFYRLESNKLFVATSDELKPIYPYKEETMDKASKTVFDANAQCCDIMNHLIKEETMNRKYNVEEYLKVWKETENGLEVVVNDNFELKEDNGKFYIIKKQPQYPKTYNECWKILDAGEEEVLFNGATASEEFLFDSFIKLKRCRDAYWKIAGNWKPDFVNYEEKFIITNYYGKVYTPVGTNYNRILIFPTEEMRDSFYENFKDLIEQCKELL